MKRVTITLIKVKSRKAMLRMLLVFISICLKSVLRYKLLVVDAYHADTLYLPSNDGEIRDNYSKPKGVREPKS